MKKALMYCLLLSAAIALSGKLYSQIIVKDISRPKSKPVSFQVYLSQKQNRIMIDSLLLKSSKLLTQSAVNENKKKCKCISKRNSYERIYFSYKNFYTEHTNRFIKPQDTDRNGFSD